MGDNLKPEKHGRDHCPGGEDPIPCLASDYPWIRRKKTFASPQTINWGGDEFITYDDVEGSTDYADYFQVHTITYQTKILQAGVYLLSAQVHWDVTFADARSLALHDGYSWSTGFTFTDATAFESASQAFTFVHRYPANSYAWLQIGLAGSTDRDISMGYFEIMRIGSYTGPDPTDDVE